MKQPGILLLVMILFISPGFSGKPESFKEALKEIEEYYLFGNYKKAERKNEDLVNDIVRALGQDNLIIARAHIQSAKIRQAGSDYDFYKRKMELAENILHKLSPAGDPDQYVTAATEAAVAYLEYGHVLKASEMLKLAEKAELSEVSDYTKNMLTFTRARVAGKLGYQKEAISTTLELLPFFQDRTSRRIKYRDKQGEYQEKKLKKSEQLVRLREAGELLNFLTEQYIAGGDFVRADSMFKENENWIRDKIRKKDITYVRHLYLHGLALEEQNETYKAAEYYEEALELSKKTRKGKYKPYSLPAVYLNEKAVYYNDLRGKERTAKQDKKIYRAKIKRFYGKESLPYLRYEILEARDNINKGNYLKAEKEFHEIKRSMSWLPENHPERIRINEFLYNIHLSNDQYKEAGGILEQLMEQSTNLYGKQSPAHHLNLLKKANFQVKYTNAFKEAEQTYRHSLQEKIEPNFLPRHPEYLNSLYTLANLYELTDRYEDALEVLQKARQHLSRHFEGHTVKKAVAFEKLAGIYSSIGKYDEAEKLLQSADKIFTQFGTSSSKIDHAITLSTMAEVNIVKGSFDRAEDILEKSFRLIRKAEDINYLESSDIIEDMAYLYIQLREFDETEEKLLESISIKEEKFGPTHRSLIKPLNLLSLLYYTVGDYTMAQRTVFRAIDLSESVFGKESLKYSESQRMLYNIYMAIGDYEKAEEAAEHVLKVQKAQYGEQHVKVASTYADLALTRYFLDSPYDEITPLFDKAVSINQQVLGTTNPQYAEILQKKAAYLLETEDIQQANALLDEANQIWISKVGERNLNTAEIYYLKGNGAYNSGNYRQAEEWYQTSGNIVRKILGDAHPDYVKALSKTGQMAFINGEKEKAADIFRETTDLYLEFVDKYFPGLSEREKAGFWNKIKHDFEFYNTLAIHLHEDHPEILEDLYDLVLNTKALMLSASIKVKQNILNSGDPKLIELYEQWQDNRDLLLSALSMSAEQREKNGIDLGKLEKEIELKEKQLSEKSELFASNLDKKNISWKDVRKSLQEKYAVEIIRFREFDKKFTDNVKYAALIISQDTRRNPEIVIYENGNNMENRLLSYYRNAMKLKIRDKFSYNSYMKPLAGAIPENSTVFFSPDGVFNQINPETIPAPGGGYMLDKYDIIRVSNTRDIISGGKKESKEDVQAVFCGNPLYHSEDIPEEQRKVTQLEGAKKEIKEINRLVRSNGWKTESTTEEEATEVYVKSVLNPGIFHVATHGFFLPDANLDNEEADGINQHRAYNNPLLRSGLLLAGGGDLLGKENVYDFNSKDGILTAFEAQNLYLDNTKLVVLSACETGLGEVQYGEGIYGLQRAFQVAGAEAVIMSLFKVDDEITRELMIAFYKHWMESGNKRQAFTRAKAQIKEKYDNPIYWGAFVMMGM